MRASRFVIRRKWAAPSRPDDPWRAAEATVAHLIALRILAEDVAGPAPSNAQPRTWPRLGSAATPSEAVQLPNPSDARESRFTVEPSVNEAKPARASTPAPCAPQAPSADAEIG